MRTFFERLSLFLVLFTPPVYGVEKSASQTTVGNKNFVGVGLSRNFPKMKSARLFIPGRDTDYTFHFRHLLNEDWAVGITGNFKNFFREEDEQPVRLLSVAQESLRRLRLYKGWNLSVGTKLIFLLPTKDRNIPAARQPEYESEVGGGVTASLDLSVVENYIFSLRADRWRGTKTRTFQGLEIAMEMSRRI